MSAETPNPEQSQDSHLAQQVQPGEGQLSKMKNFIAGIITAGADNDPAAVTTYAVAGASTGYSQLWLMVLATPMLIAVQSICARIGDVTHKGLGDVIREHFPKPLAYLVTIVLFLTTLLIISADIMGVAAGFQLLLGVKALLWLVPIALVVWLGVLFLNFESITKYLSVVIVVFLAYIVSAFLARPNWGEVGKNIILPPIQFKVEYLVSAIGLLGATFTPSMFFWQTKEEIEEKHTDKEEKARKQNVLLAPGFIFAQLVSIFIMIATAAALFSQHQQVNSTMDAAKALEPVAGPFAKYLFAIGLIGSGFIAIPVLAASAGYMVAETFGWKQSLSEKVDQAKGFYIVITLALFMGVEIDLAGVNPIQAMFFSQALAGVVGPILLILILIIANRKSVMGEHTNHWFDNVFGGMAFLFMTAAIVLLLMQSIIK